jgi:hypothetical protein
VRASRAAVAPKVVVESAHPYAQGRELLLQTVTIPGATSLLLAFDAQCRTASAGSDFLMVFAGAAVEGAPPIPIGDAGQVRFTTYITSVVSHCSHFFFFFFLVIGSIGRQ